MIFWKHYQNLLHGPRIVRLILFVVDLHSNLLCFAAFALFNTSQSVATMVGKGLLANIGAHGEPPLGLNYHAEMEFTAQGGLSNYEVLLPFVCSFCIP